MAREVVTFSNEALTLYGVLYKPLGPGPFPAVLYNHGGAPGMLNEQAFTQLGPLFADHGWVFFAPYRRGQGFSQASGAFIGDEIAAARNEQAWHGALLAAAALLLLLFVVARRWRSWQRTALGASLGLASVLAVHLTSTRAAAAAMVRLLDTEQFSDQAAALRWLRTQPFVHEHRIATAGNSFGGIQAVLGAARLEYCAVVDASGGAENWARAPQLQELMTRAVSEAKAPIFFFQALNDYDLSPSETLAAAMRSAAKPFELKIYPAYGSDAAAGHKFAWAGSQIWGADVLRFFDAHCR